MSLKKSRIASGIELIPSDTSTDILTREGEIAVDENDHELKAYLDGAKRGVVTKDQVQTLTNKTINSPVINTPTGITKADVGLSNVDNTSDATKNAASVALTNKTIDGSLNTITNITATTNANLTGPITSVGNATSVASQTGTGSKFVMDTSPTLVTPNIGVASGTSLNTSGTVTGSNLSGTNTGDQIISDATITTTDITTNNFSTSKHGFTPKGTNVGNFLKDDGTWAPAGTSLVTKDEGSTISSATTSYNFVGAGVAATNIGNDITVTINGGGAATSAVDNVFNINDSGDPTKQINFDAGGTTGTKTTIAAAQTANRTITLPNVTDTVAVLASAQVLTNKTVVVASNTITTAAAGNLTSTELNASLNELQQDVDSNRLQNRIFLLDATESIGTWSTGDNATFLGGGTISGTFAKETTTPLNGSASYKYTQAAGSLDDYLASPAQTVPLRFRGQQTYLSFPYQYDGTSSDIRIIVYDATNSTIISQTTDNIIATNGATQSNLTSVVIPLTCTQIRIGFHVKALNSGKILSFDDVQLSTDTFSGVNVNNETEWEPAIFSSLAWTNYGTVTSNLWVRRSGSELKLRGKVTVGTVSASVGQIPFPINFGSILASSKISANSPVGIITVEVSSTSSTAVVIAQPSTNYLNVSDRIIAVGTNPSVPGPSNGLASAGNTLVIQEISIPIQGWAAQNSSVAIPSQQISSDTISFVFQSTALTGNEAVGTFNTYTYASASNTATIAATAPTQTVSSMNVNGIQVFARAYNATSTAASPARVDIFIGKGLKSKQVDAYAAAAKASELSYDFRSVTAAITSIDGTDITYSEVTGILSINAATDASATSTTRGVGITPTNGTAQTSGYFVFNASKTPSLVSIPAIQGIKLQDAKPTTSGTSIDFTGIPASAKRITVMLNGVSTNGTSQRMLRIGDGSISTTNYKSVAGDFVNTGALVAAYATNGFVLTAGSGTTASAASVLDGSIILSYVAPNVWTISGSFSTSAGAALSTVGGSAFLTGTLDRIRLTTVNGTDTFDAGSVNISWEF